MFHRGMFCSCLPLVLRLAAVGCAVGILSLSPLGCDGTFSGGLDIGNPDIDIETGDTTVNVETNVTQEQDVTVNIGSDEDPTAIVTAGAQITARRGDEVTLDASESLPGTGGGSLSYSWAQVTTFDVFIRNGTTATATLGIPFDIPNGAQIVMKVTVTAGSRNDDTQITIIVEGGDTIDLGEECETDSECDDEDECTDDFCIGGECEFFDNGECGSECAVDEDCDDDKFCSSEFCDGGFCVFEITDCGPGFFCDRGSDQCLPVDSECIADSDCEDDNLCTFEFCEDGFCFDDGFVECGPNSVCQPGSGACVSTVTGELCSNDCFFAFDGECDDGGMNSFTSLCARGSDCNDCGPRRQNELCSEDCPSSSDGECDDGGSNSLFAICPLGSDCIDCGPRTFLCSDDCFAQFDGICNDGGPGSETNTCGYGTDCFDCGARDADVIACTDASNCDDGLFCNGPEECLFGVCFTGFEPCAGSCDELTDTCGP